NNILGSACIEYASQILMFSTYSNNPIANFRSSSYHWFAIGKSAITKKRIWGKSDIVGNDIGE
ncbi:MAG: hypothetical protein WBM07_18475, partial [Chitinivibrionales bacterium]